MEMYEQAGLLGVTVGMVFMMLVFSLMFMVMAEQDEVSIFGTSFVRVDAEQENDLNAVVFEVRECVEWNSCEDDENGNESALIVSYSQFLPDCIGDYLYCDNYFSCSGVKEYDFVSKNYDYYEILGADIDWNSVHYVRAVKDECVCWSDEYCARERRSC